MLLVAASAKATGNIPHVLGERGTFKAGDRSAIENTHERKALRDAKPDVKNFIGQQLLFHTNDDYKKHGIHKQ